MLLKNFGVSRHGRLIFYDYDELCPLTECNFRALPQPATPEEEMADEPWFAVGDRDIFPEEFRSFLGLSGELLQVFLQAHEELLRPEFWVSMQDRVREGLVLEILPYPEGCRLGHGRSGPRRCESVGGGVPFDEELTALREARRVMRARGVDLVAGVVPPSSAASTFPASVPNPRLLCSGPRFGWGRRRRPGAGQASSEPVGARRMRC